MTSPSRSRRASPWVLLPWLVLVVGVAGSAVAGEVWQAAIDRTAERRTDAALDDVEQALAAELDAYEALLSGVGLAFQEGDVTASRVHGAFEPADLAGRYPGIVAVAWVVPVAEADVPAFEISMRALGEADFSLKEGSIIGFVEGVHAPGQERFVIQYAEPALASDAIQGLDLGAAATMRPTLEQTRASGALTATPRLALPPEAEFLGPPGTGAFFAFAPVFVDYETVVEEARRSESLRGWVGAYVTGQTFFDRAVARSPVRVDVYEGDELVAGSGRAAERAGRRAAAPERSFEAMGRTWRLVPRHVPAAAAAGERGPRRVLALGIGISAVMFLAVWLLGRGRLAAMADAERAATSLRSSEARFRSVVQHASDLIWIEGSDGAVEYVSPSSERLLGWTPAELAERGVGDLFAVGSLTGSLGAVGSLTGSLGAVGSLTGSLGESGVPGGAARELTVRHRNGALRCFSVLATDLRDDDDVRGTVYHGRDVTERKAIEARLEHQASHDPLTGLPNRALLSERLGAELARARTEDGVALLFVDLDGFKVINDSLGHDVGDDLLTSVSRRLVSAVRPTDVVTRFGGDEFVVLCGPVADVAEAERLAERTLAALRPPHALAAGDITITASLGIALGARGTEAEALLRNADVAMYRAKERGRNRVEVFDDALRARAVARQRLDHDLRHILHRHELEVHFQPIVDLADGRTVAVEALARWPRGTPSIPPSDFIPVAEDIGLITELGDQVLDRSLAALASWRRSGDAGPELELTVNVAPRQLLEAGFPARVASLLERHGVEAGALCLEITENSYLGDDAVEVLGELKRLGLRLALDDFGTGYSSLLQLKRLPLDVLKVDRRFVEELVEDDDFVAAVMTLATAQRLEVVAEGVEVGSQAAILRRLGCQRAQGWLYAPALPAAELATLLAADRQRLGAPA